MIGPKRVKKLLSEAVRWLGFKVKDNLIIVKV
jgi:hypothetical protein